MTGKELKSFSERWVYRSGCPVLRSTFEFNRKRNTVEWRISQRSSSEGSEHVYDPAQLLFQDAFTIRVHETDGTFDHVVQLENTSHDYEFPFHSKFRRTRKLRRTDANNNDAFPGDMDDININNLDETTADLLDGLLPSSLASNNEMTDKLATMTTGGGLSLSSNSTAMHSTTNPTVSSTAALSSVDEDALLIESPILWIRLNPELEWVGSLRFEQTPHRWCHQLVSDRDVIAQLEAIGALCDVALRSVVPSLMRILVDPHCFFRVRIEAALALSQCGDDLGPLQLKRYFRQRYCEAISVDDSKVASRWMVRSNDFRRFDDYFIQRGLLRALANVRLDKELTAPLETLEMLLDCIRFNDNTTNPYDDSSYMADLLLSLADGFLFSSSRQRKNESFSSTGKITLEQQSHPHSHHHHQDHHQMQSLTPRATTLLAETLSEIEHHLRIDKYLPSYQQCITKACLEALTRLSLYDLIVFPLDVFLMYASNPLNLLDVRVTAMTSLCHSLLVEERDPNPKRNGTQSKFNPQASLPLSTYIVPSSTTSSSPFPVKELLVYFLDVMIQKDEDPAFRRETSRLLASLFAEVQPLSRLKIALTTSPGLLSYLVERLCTLINTDTVYDDAVRWALVDVLDRAREAFVDTPFIRQLDQMESRLPKVKLVVPATSRSLAMATAATMATSSATLPASAFLHGDVYRNCKDILQKLILRPESWPFREPVDSATLPDYFTVIRHPMDLGTIKKNLESRSVYTKKEEVERDIRLVFNNCFQYNSPGSLVHELGRRLLMRFERWWPMERQQRDALPENPPFPFYERFLALLTKLLGHQDSWPFLMAVDPKTAPGYYDVIRRPMHLFKIDDTLEAKGYSSEEGLVGDIRQLFDNCYAFNKEDSLIYQQARRLETYFKKLLTRARHGKEEMMGEEGDMGSIEKNTLDENDKEMTFYPSNYPSLEEKQRVMMMKEPSSYDEHLLVDVDGDEDEDEEKREDIKEKLDIKEGQDVAMKIPVLMEEKNLIERQLEKEKGKEEEEKEKEEKGIVVKEDASLERKGLMHDERESVDQLLMKLIHHKDSAPFRVPVDAIAAGVPQYYEIIKHPMDLATIQCKLEQNVYLRLEDVVKDVDLMFNNAFHFNAKGTFVYLAGKRLLGYFEKQWKKLTSPKEKEMITVSEEVNVSKREEPTINSNSNVTINNKELGRILKEVQRLPESWPFLKPVDPQEAFAPDYFTVIRHPMDFGTMNTKWKEHRYMKETEFEADARLVFSNCFTYNPPGTLVHDLGRKVEMVFNRLWTRWRKESGNSLSEENVDISESVDRQNENDEASHLEKPQKLKIKFTFK